MEELELLPSFPLSSLLLAYISYTFRRIKYVIALLAIKGNRMVPESSNYHLFCLLSLSLHSCWREDLTPS